MAWKNAVVIVAFVMGCITPQSGPGISIRPEVLQSFGQIQRHFEVETARCLLGTVEDGTVEITGVHPPFILTSERSRVQFVGCPEGTVGWFHNHPSANTTGWCELSEQDRRTGDSIKNTFAVTVVSCSRNKLIYRLRGDDEEHELPIPW